MDAVWEFVNKNSALLAKICGGTVTAIVALLGAYTTYVSRPTKTTKSDPNKDKEINDAIKQLRERLDLLDSTLRQRMVGVRRILVATWATFFLLIATLGFYSVTAKNKIDSISEKANNASVAAGQALQEVRDDPTNRTRLSSAEGLQKSIKRQHKKTLPEKEKNQQNQKPQDQS